MDGVALQVRGGHRREACLAVRLKGAFEPRMDESLLQPESHFGTWALTRGSKSL